MRPAESEQFSEAPRNVVAATFIVRNDTGRSLDAEPHLIVPLGWRVMTPDLPFTLAERASAIRLVSFVIPERAVAGDYTVTYEVRGRQQPGTSAAYTVRVHVMPAMKVQVLSVDSPDFAIAGERYRSTFLIRNLGNAPVIAKFTARTAQGAEPNPRNGTVELRAGETKPVTIESEAPKLRRRAGEQVTLAVEVTGTSIRETASSATEIVPRVSPDEAYRTLGTRMDVAFVGREVDGKRDFGWQPAISGSGALDDENHRQLSFRLRGPDARNRGSLGAADEYWVRYRDDTVGAVAGDNTYGLSPLTEPGRYGSGAQLAYDKDAWGLSTYHMRDRFSDTGIEQSALGAYYRFTRDTRVDFTMLDIVGGEFPGTTRSLRTRTRWSPGLSTDFELGTSDGGGERGDAFRGSLYGSLHALRYYAIGWRADPEYRGYLRDKKYLSTGFDLPRRDGWGLRGYYRLQDWHVEEPRDLDPTPIQNVQDLIRNAPTEQQASLGTQRSFGSATRLTLDFNLRTRTDAHTTPDIDVSSHSARIGLSRSLRNVSFLYSIERGNTRNETAQTRFDTVLHMLSASWQASPTQAYTLYVLRDDNAYSNEREAPQTTFGVSANCALGSTTSLSLSAQRNNTQTNRGGLYNLALYHERPDGGRFSLVGRRIKGRLAQNDFMFTYSVPFALPVSRQLDVGSVRGRVFDSETGTGLKSVVLNLDGLTAVTDGNGDFAFPVVKASTHRLSMDRTNVDVSKVPVGDLPMDVSVSTHEREQVQIALTRTVSLGVVIRFRPDTANGASASASGAENVLVTFSRGDTTYRRLTDAEGRVKLGGLPPGTWTVTLAADTLPAGYSLATNEQRLEASPGTAVSAEFELSPLTRDLRMLAPLKVR